MVNMVVPDVGGKPGHDPAGFHVARRFHRGLLVGPSRFVVEFHAGKVVLGIKQVGANGIRDEMRKKLSQQLDLPTEEMNQRDPDQDVDRQGKQTVKVPAGIIEEWTNAHPVKEHKKITEQDRQWMSDEEVLKAFPFWRLHILSLGHDGKRPDMRALESGIVFVMVVV